MTRDRNAPAPSGVGPDHAGVRPPPPLVYAAGLLAGWLLHRWRPISIVNAHVIWWIGAALIVAAVALNLAAFREFQRARTSVIPVRPTTALVVTGPFRFTRNPLYLSMTMFGVGLALMVNSLWMLALLVPVVVAIRYLAIAREEAYLERKFGEAYTGYRARVRRWF